MLRPLRTFVLGPRGAAMLAVTGQGRIVWANRHARSLFKAWPLRGASLLDLLLLPDKAADYLSSVATSPHGSVVGWQTLRTAPDSRTLRLQATPIRFPKRQPLILLSVTDHRSKVPYTDGLTGCVNRQGMQAVVDALNVSAPLAILNLNAMGAFNDLHGFTAGDAAIVTVANRLRSGVGDRGTVVRWGGDEFVVVLPNQDAEHSERLLVELLTAVAEPIAIGSESVTISATAGMTMFAPGSPQQALTELSDAMWHAKRQGVPYTIYKPADSKG